MSKLREKRYPENLLREYIKKSKAWSDVCRYFGIKPGGGSQTYLKHVAVKANIDFSHFLGQSYNKGRTDFKKKDALLLCSKGDKYVCSDRLKKSLIRDGYKNAECEICGITKWQGELTVLELHHIDSDHFNNELNNLQILCPNCHALITRKNCKNKVDKRRKERRKERPKKLKQEKIKKLRPRKIEWPNKETLIELVNNNSWCAIGRIYGVSDNAVRKWAKNYGLIKAI